jgi:Ni/Co efflux regulator RcnB
MNAGYRYITFLFLMAALSAPAAIVTRAASQDEHRDEHRDEHHDQKRVYDRTHKDYHNWDNNEDRYYHQYFTENHKEYRDYSKLNRRDQDVASRTW